MTTFDEIQQAINEFDQARQWTDLHPGDVAKSIVIEAAELLEHFQRDNYKKWEEKNVPQKDMQAIAHEIGDLFSYLFKFCRETGLDPVECITNKLDKIAKKYPVDYREEGYWQIKAKHRKEGTN